MSEIETSAWIFLDKNEFNLFKQEVLIPEIDDQLDECKPDSHGEFGIELTLDQLDEAHTQVACLIDEAPTKKQRELWDGILLQLANSLDEAALESDDEMELHDEDEEEFDEEFDNFDDDCGDCSDCDCEEE